MAVKQPSADGPDPYRRASKYYDRVVEPMNRGLRAIGMAMHPLRPGAAVLDVGCGTGAHLARYLDAGCRVFGIDTSPSMLALARRRLGDRADLRLGDGADLPYEDETFDLVIAAMLVHELDPDARRPVLTEIRRVVKPDGRVLVIDFHAGDLRFPKGWLRRALSVATELAAGWRHYRCYRSFMAAGGIPGATDGRMTVAEQKLVAGRNVGLYLLRP